MPDDEAARFRKQADECREQAVHSTRNRGSGLPGNGSSWRSQPKDAGSKVAFSWGTLFCGPHFPSMARYFFNIHDEGSDPDKEGEELPNNEAAWHEATLITGELFKDFAGKLRPGQEWSIEVTDERRNPLYFIRVSAEEI
jgi:hypothetical protein